MTSQSTIRDFLAAKDQEDIQQYIPKQYSFSKDERKQN